ncbi:MAG: DUF1064 domain-containing protein [Bacillota bacterium]|nr:DUF1064 domain-containing protein [Bacillota bacterium]
MSKYNSKNIVIDGINFDSKDEGLYYEVLKKRQAKGEIKCFELQPKYELIEGFKSFGKKYKGITYKPDFIIYHNDNSEECVEVKGMLTQASELRIKLFRWKYPNLKLSVVSRNLKHGDEYGFIDFYQLKAIRSKNRKKKKSKEI